MYIYTYNQAETPHQDAGGAHQLPDIHCLPPRQDSSPGVQPYTLNPGHQTLNPRPKTLHPTPKTQNPKP